MTTSSSAPEAIHLKSVALAFRRDARRAPLSVIQEGLDLAIHQSEFIAIVGPSGCGKTSLLRIMGGLLKTHPPDTCLEGEIQIHDLEPEQAKNARMFGCAFQNPALLPWRTVLQNILLPLELGGDLSKDALTRTRNLLQLVGLATFEHVRPLELSGGMQQRLNLARALIHRPKILLLDEPFASLDDMTRERLNLALLEIHQTLSPTIVLVTHSLYEAAFLADRVVVLSERPARVKAVLQSPLPKKRTGTTQLERPFIEFLRELRSIFFQDTVT
ncbi:ABC transporter ATP-binding protein [Candidatus Peregrinibacteria bacterium]|nr:ABC transporter ATP-binding protein [Candidatus Peregrinibacteria bacterium]